MRPIALLALCLLPLTGCVQTTCTPRTVDPTGDLSLDLLGAWDGFGVDSRLVYVFDGSGAWRWLEPPNMYAPNGLQSESTWAVDGSTLSLTHPGGTITEAEATVDSTELLLVWAEGGAEQSWAPSTCTGYGFEG